MLLEKLDGRVVEIGETKQTLQVADATIERVELWWGEKLLYVLSDPNLAFIFLMFGFYGMLFELYTAGWGVSGTLGIISLLIGCFSLSILPLNYAALALIAVAMGMFVAEAFVTSFGALTVGGVVCLILGGLMLVDTPFEFMRVSASIVVPIAIATALITVILVTNIIKGYTKKVQTGDKSMVGESIKSVETFEKHGDQYSGRVWLHGEYWRAVSQEPIKAEQLVVIEKREGLTLNVKPVKKE